MRPKPTFPHMDHKRRSTNSSCATHLFFSRKKRPNISFPIVAASTKHGKKNQPQTMIFSKRSKQFLPWSWPTFCTNSGSQMSREKHTPWTFHPLNVTPWLQCHLSPMLRAVIPCCGEWSTHPTTLLSCSRKLLWSTHPTLPGNLRVGWVHRQKSQDESLRSKISVRLRSSWCPVRREPSSKIYLATQFAAKFKSPSTSWGSAIVNGRWRDEIESSTQLVNNTSGKPFGGG